jgi:hypothetical protein
MVAVVRLAVAVAALLSLGSDADDEERGAATAAVG